MEKVGKGFVDGSEPERLRSRVVQISSMELDRRVLLNALLAVLEVLGLEPANE